MNRKLLNIAYELDISVLSHYTEDTLILLIDCKLSGLNRRFENYLNMGTHVPRTGDEHLQCLCGEGSIPPVSTILDVNSKKKRKTMIRRFKSFTAHH